MRLVLLAFVALALLAAPAHAAVVCSPNDDGDPPLVIGDTDGDDFADIAIGLPDSEAVVVRQSTRGTVRLAAPKAGQGFGAAAAIGDVDADGCADVLVGAPGAGQVLVYRGAPTGIATVPASVISGPAGEDFGAAVVLANRRGSTTTDLWIGAPGRAAGAGAVDHYTVAAGGAPALKGAFTAAKPAAGERFGSVLAPDEGGAYVGVPRHRVGARRKAGAVERLRFSETTGAARKTLVTTLPHARAGDRLGASLAGGGGSPVAGAPGRRVRGRRHAGAVLVVDGREYTQDSPGVPGKARSGNRFGTSVAFGVGLTCQEDLPFAAGAPGDGAGSVTLVTLQNEGCRSVRLTSGHGLPKVEGGAPRIGTALGLRRARDDLEEDAFDTLLVGAVKAGRALLRDASSTPVRTSSFALPATGRQIFAVPLSGSTLDD